MYRWFVSVLFLSAAIMISSCSDDDEINPFVPQQITGSGNLVTVTRDLPAIHSINFTTVGNVNLTSGGQQSVSITVDDNVEQYIMTTVIGGELIISSGAAVVLNDFDLTVNLSLTDLESVKLRGVGNINSTNNFDVDNVDVELSGVGNITLYLTADYLASSLGGVGNLIVRGTADKHLCHHHAVGMVHTYGMVTDTTVAILEGTGSAEVNVTEYLNVTIAGAGSVYYLGDPTIDQTITGTGRVYDSN